uniref:S phase cyclin A-associated protein in the endoplasmic reticulum n=1 Tax=Syphacia muris TaxID=451379 RepID=A0A0N5AR62_9BILA
MPMTSSLIKIFKFKKSKDNEAADSTLLVKLLFVVHLFTINSKFCDAFYLKKRNDDTRFSLRSPPVPTYRSSKYAIYIGGMSWSRPSAPYSVITEPKKTKSTRSCPGGVSAPKFHLSSKDSQRVSTNARNTLNNHLPNSKGLETSTKTSEYGSCEPSPTNALQDSTYFHQVHQDSDYDNDCAVHERYEAEIRRLKRRLKDDRHHYREQVINAQNEAEHLRREAKKIGRTMALMQRTIDCERHKNQSLKRRLRDSEAIISELQEEITALKKSAAEREHYDCYENPGASGAVGAGEALCALTQSNSDLFNMDLNPQFSDAPDEVRNFRITHYDSVVETPRSSSPSAEPLETKSDSFAKEVVLCNEKLLDNDLRGSTKRSYSDSELPTLVAALKTGDESVEDSDSKPAVSSPVTQIANKNSNEYKTNGGNDAVWSSDEDSVARELIFKQLRRRGDVVRFIPPRRTVRDINFKHFGQRERSALAEFDYLHDLSTDASAIASSPDYPHCNSAIVPGHVVDEPQLVNA